LEKRARSVAFTRKSGEENVSGIVLLALLLSFLAGISTTIGAVVTFFIKKPTHRILGLTLGFSAGVMINVSFVELLTKSMDEIGFLHANLAFFVGMAMIFAIDVLIPRARAKLGKIKLGNA